MPGTLEYSAVMAAAWQRCREFNEKAPIGTKVRYRSLLDLETSYDIKETTTRSAAWALPSGAAVVMIVGKTGGISLDHIELI